DGQTNALGEGWLRLVTTTTTSSTNSFVVCVNSNLTYAGFPALFPAPSTTNAILLPGSVETTTSHGSSLYGTNGVCAALKLSQPVTPSGVTGVTNKAYASFLIRVPSLGK